MKRKISFARRGGVLRMGSQLSKYWNIYWRLIEKILLSNATGNGDAPRRARRTPRGDHMRFPNAIQIRRSHRTEPRTSRHEKNPNENMLARAQAHLETKRCSLG